MQPWNKLPELESLLEQTAIARGLTKEQVHEVIESVYTSCDNGMKAGFKSLRIMKFGVIYNKKLKKNKK